MSATNRGSERNEADYYITPSQTIQEFLTCFQQLEPNFDFTSSRLCDPCAGGDAKYPMAYPTELNKLGANNITTFDLRLDSPAEFAGCNYLTNNQQGEYDGMFTNPPYNLTLDFVKKALTDVREGGFVAMLVRLNLYGSQKRRVFWQKNMPKYTIVHATRPSFLTKEQKKELRLQGKNASTDATEYAHFVWQKGYNEPFSKIVIV